MFLEDTKEFNPTAPPPIALLGHSRGGLLIRQMLKEKLRERSTRGRVRWAITLHSPHSGSEMARWPESFPTSWMNNVDLGPLDQNRNQIQNAIRAMLHPLTEFVLTPGEQELAPDSPLLRNLANGEQTYPEINYISFGGTSVRYSRVYAWFFTLDSYEPHRREREIKRFFIWRRRPAEIDPISPLADEMPDFNQEVTPGLGDFLVSNASSRFPWPDTHYANSLNHVEVLWNPQVQGTVRALLLEEPIPIPISLTPSFVTLNADESQQFTVDPPDIVAVRYSIDFDPRFARAVPFLHGSSRIDEDGVFHAPSVVFYKETLTVRATALDDSGRSATARVRLIPNIVTILKELGLTFPG